MTSRYGMLLLILLLTYGCNKSQKEQIAGNQPTDSAGIEKHDSVSIQPDADLIISDTSFIVLSEHSKEFQYDMKYATEDNFLKKAVYICDKCLVRKEVADALIQANDSLISLGFHIKFFDCYRPLDVQKLMWKIYPNPGYVANPYTSGSIHNRGGAVDITLADTNGNELEMGTSFDHFGKEAHHSYSNLPDTVLNNRRLLKSTMERYGFKAIRTEWWHYNFHNKKPYSLSNFVVECD